MSSAKLLADEAKASAHYTWRKEVSDGMPELAARVFALRGASYYGCGCHYEMERRLGSLMSKINDNSNPLYIHDPIIETLAFDELVEDVAQAEWSAANKADPTGPGSPWHKDPSPSVGPTI